MFFFDRNLCWDFVIATTDHNYQGKFRNHICHIFVLTANLYQSMSLSFVRINDFEEVLSGNCDDIPEVTRGLEVLSFDTFRQNLLGYILCAYYTHIYLYTYIQTYYICSWRCFLLIGEICQIEVMRRLKSATGLKSWDSWRLQEKTSRFSFFCSYLSCCFPDSMTGIWLRCIWIWQAAFYMIGGMSDVKEKAAKLAAVAAGKWRGWWRRVRRVAFILWATESQRATILWSEI